MIQINLASLVKHLNPFSRQALEAAAAECMSQQASEITVAHVLLQMLASVRSDLRVISERADIDLNELRRALTVENYATSRTADNYPAFSPMLVEWLKEGGGCWPPQRCSTANCVAVYCCWPCCIHHCVMSPAWPHVC